MVLTEIDMASSHRNPAGPAEDSALARSAFAALLADRAATSGSGVALRHKRLGLWRTWSWRELWVDVRSIAQALIAAGLEPGDVVVIAGARDPELLVGFLATLLAGGRVAPLKAVGDDGQWAAWVAELRPRVIIADRVDTAIPLLAGVRKTGHGVGFVSVHGAPGALARPDAVWTATFDDWRTSGAAEADDQHWQERAGLATGASPTMVFTEASASGVRIWSADEARLVAAGRACAARERLQHDDEALAEEPVWFIPEIASGLAAWLVAGFRLNLPEGAATHAVDRREIGPTYVFARRAALARLASRALEAAGPAVGLRRRLLEGALSAAGQSRRRSGLPDPRLPVLRFLLLRPLRDVLGLARARVLVSVDGELDPHTHEFLSGLGVGPTPLSAAQRLRAEPTTDATSAAAERRWRAGFASSAPVASRASTEDTLPVAARLGALY